MAKLKPKTLAAIGRWGMLLPAVLIIGGGGVAKFTDAESWRTMFVDWGYPAWMSTVTGVLEVGAVVLMLITATRFYGAALGAAVMVAAAVTRIVAGEYGFAFVPLLAVLFAGVSAWWSRPAFVDRLVSRGQAED